MLTIDKAIIVNIVPYGPKDDNGIGKNARIEYINLSKCLDNERFKGYSTTYNVVYARTQKEFFQKLSTKDILKPCKLYFLNDNKLSYNSLEDIEFLK